MKISLFLLAALVLVYGCAKHIDDSANVGVGHSVASKGLPNGWTRIESEDKSVSIGLPPDWKRTELSAGSLRKRLQQRGASDQSHAPEKILDQGGFKLVFVSNVASDRKSPSTGNIIALHTAMDLATLAEKNQEGIATGAQGLVMTDDVLVDSPAKVLTYMKFDHSGNPVDHFCYIGLRGETAYICSFGFPQGTPNEKETATKIASTMTAS